MSDKELRQILAEVMEDLASGRLVHWRSRKFLRRAVAPALFGVAELVPPNPPTDAG